MKFHEAKDFGILFVLLLVVAETENDPRPFCFRGDHCIKEFLKWLDTLTLEDTHQVNTIAHNFQGYNGYFVVH